MMKRTFVILAFILVVSLGTGFYHGYYKEYLYEDEVLSYTLSNSLHGGYFNLKAGEWYKGSDLYEYLYVIPGYEFNWGNTMHNQMVDSHPPLYALSLHAACSLIPGRFSKWCGIGLNLVCMAFFLIVFYFLIRELMPESPYVASVFCIACGLNAEMITLLVFIRMYILLMVFTTLCMYWHIRAFRRELSFRSFLALSCITYAGIMTHYFYGIIAFYLAVAVCIHFILEKKIRYVWYYIISMAASGVLYILSWYKSLARIRQDDATKDVMAGVWSVQSVLTRLQHMFIDTNISVFGGRLKLVLCVVLLCGLYLLIRDRGRLRRAFLIDPRLRMLTAVSVLFFITVSVITPYEAIRYVSPAFPFFILLIALTLDQVAQEVFRSRMLGVLVIALFFIYPELQVLHGGLFDSNRAIINEVSSAYQNDICLFSDNISPEENVFELKKFDEIYVYNKGHMEDIPKVSEADEIVIYIPEDEDPEEYAEIIRIQNPDLKELERLYVAYYSTCYLLHK